MSAPKPPPSPRALIVTFVLLIAATLLVTQGPTALAPLAGPWAARLLGHSCGVYDFLPLPSILLALAGPPSLYLATRRRPLWRIIPALLWATPWLLAGLVSTVNTLE